MAMVVVSCCVHIIAQTDAGISDTQSPSSQADFIFDILMSFILSSRHMSMPILGGTVPGWFVHW